MKGPGFPFKVTKMFWNWIEPMVAQRHECTKCHWIVHFRIAKAVKFMLCEFFQFNLLKSCVRITWISQWDTTSHPAVWKKWPSEMIPSVVRMGVLGHLTDGAGRGCWCYGGRAEPGAGSPSSSGIFTCPTIWPREVAGCVGGVHSWANVAQGWLEETRKPSEALRNGHQHGHSSEIESPREKG